MEVNTSRGTTVSQSQVSKKERPCETSKNNSLDLAIPSRTLKVIHLMFPSGSQDRGTVQWLDFVSLLSEMGFVEAHRADSARTFKSDKRSITFHKSHPSTDLGSLVLWRIGRRLSKRFGWKQGDVWSGNLGQQYPYQQRHIRVCAGSWIPRRRRVSTAVHGQRAARGDQRNMSGVGVFLFSAKCFVLVN